MVFVHKVCQTVRVLRNVFSVVVLESAGALDKNSEGPLLTSVHHHVVMKHLRASIVRSNILLAFFSACYLC